MPDVITGHHCCFDVTVDISVYSYTLWKTELHVGTKGSGPSWNLEVSGELTVSFSLGREMLITFINRRSVGFQNSW